LIFITLHLMVTRRGREQIFWGGCVVDTNITCHIFGSILVPCWVRSSLESHRCPPSAVNTLMLRRLGGRASMPSTENQEGHFLSFQTPTMGTRGYESYEYNLSYCFRPRSDQATVVVVIKFVVCTRGAKYDQRWSVWDQDCRIPCVRRHLYRLRRQRCGA